MGQIANSLLFRAETSNAPILVMSSGALRAFVERSLAAHERVWAAAGHPNTVFQLAYRDLVRITGGAEIDAAQP